MSVFTVLHFFTIMIFLLAFKNNLRIKFNNLDSLIGIDFFIGHRFLTEYHLLFLSNGCDPIFFGSRKIRLTRDPGEYTQTFPSVFGKLWNQLTGTRQRVLFKFSFTCLHCINKCIKTILPSRSFCDKINITILFCRDSRSKLLELFFGTVGISFKMIIQFLYSLK